MNDAEVERQIDQMVRFIKQEAQEKANEIAVSAEEVRWMQRQTLAENCETRALRARVSCTGPRYPYRCGERSCHSHHDFYPRSFLPPPFPPLQRTPPTLQWQVRTTALTTVCIPPPTAFAMGAFSSRVLRALLLPLLRPTPNRVPPLFPWSCSQHPRDERFVRRSSTSRSCSSWRRRRPRSGRTSSGGRAKSMSRRRSSSLSS